MADDALDAHAGEPLQAADHLAKVFAVVAQVEREQGGLLDVVVVSADGVAMLAEDLELARNFGSGEEIAGIGILGDQPQGFLFPAAADEDGWVRAREGLRRVERALELIVLATERLFAAAFAFPHLLADLECLLEPLEPLLDGRERYAEAAALGFVPCGADAQPGAAAGEDVESGDRLGENARLMVDDARHHGAEFRSLGHRRNVAERAVAFEHLVVFRAVHADLPEVVHHPDGIETGLVRRPRNVGERAAEVGRPRRPGEISDIESELHTSSSSCRGIPTNHDNYHLIASAYTRMGPCLRRCCASA